MGLVKYNKNGFLNKYERENPYVFLGNLILPKEQIEYITRGIQTGTKSSVPLDELEAEVIAARIVEKLSAAKGKIKGSVYSNGGSASLENSGESEELQRKNAKVVYTILNIGDIIMLEAIGQKNNAIFIGKDRDDLEEVLEKFGRRGILDNGFYKICHDPSDADEKKYNVEPILQLLDMARKNPELLLNILDQLKSDGRQYSYMKTVEAKYYSLSQAGQDISKKDVFDSVDRLMGKGKQTKAKGEKTHEE